MNSHARWETFRDKIWLRSEVFINTKMFTKNKITKITLVQVLEDKLMNQRNEDKKGLFVDPHNDSWS